MLKTEFKLPIEACRSCLQCVTWCNPVSSRINKPHQNTSFSFHEAVDQREPLIPVSIKQGALILHVYKYLRSRRLVSSIKGLFSTNTYSRCQAAPQSNSFSQRYDLRFNPFLTVQVPKKLVELKFQDNSVYLDVKVEEMHQVAATRGWTSGHNSNFNHSHYCHV